LFHKISNDLTNNHNRITIEDLAIKKMKESDKTHRNRMISDVSWNSLFTKIKYKAEARNVIVREINPAYTSQRCHACGHIDEKNRDRVKNTFECVKCGHKADPDLNASLNIRDYDLWSSEQKTRWAARSIKSSQVLDNIDDNVILARFRKESAGSLVL
jgi:IS605 OrfB family transposase